MNEPAEELLVGPEQVDELGDNIGNRADFTGWQVLTRPIHARARADEPCADAPEVDTTSTLVIAALLRGENDTAAAAGAGISLRSLYRLKATSEFQAVLRSARWEQYRALSGMLATAGLEAIQYLRKVMNSTGSEYSSRDKLLAAAGLLQRAREERDYTLLTEATERLDALESRTRLAKNNNL